MDNIAGAVGAAIGIIFVIGLLFMQCVYPFIKGAPTETVDCSSESLARHCDNPNTLAGFMSELCGREKFSITVTAIEMINIGERNYEPAEIDMEVHCGKVDFGFAYFQGDGPKSLEEYKTIAKSDKSRLLIDVMEEWQSGQIAIDGARRLLLDG